MSAPSSSVPAVSPVGDGGAPPASPPTRRGRFAHVDAFRAVAVMLVVISHAGFEQWVRGGGGVTIFFTISGFVITWVLLRERERTGAFDWRAFYVKRFLKLLPPLLIALPVATFVLAPLLGGWGAIAWGPVLSQFTFTYNWWRLAAGESGVGPGTNVVWSLAIEEQFYLVFAPIWLLVTRLRRARLWLAVVTIGVCLGSLGLRVAFVAAGDTDRIYLGSDTRAGSIGLGILAALLWARWRERPGAEAGVRRAVGAAWVPVLAVVIYLVGTALPGDGLQFTLRFTLQSTAAALGILWGLCATTRPDGVGAVNGGVLAVLASRPVQWLGAASYSIYLTHLTWYWVLDRVIDPPQAEWWIMALKVATGPLWGLLLWRVVEVPVERWKRRRYVG